MSRIGELLARTIERVKSRFAAPPSGLKREITMAEEWSRERERIARELHDTFLEGFVAATVRLDAAVRQVPDDSPGKPALSDVLATMQRLIGEGRDTLQGLRQSGIASMSLGEAFALVSEEFALPSSVRIRVFVNGHTWRVKPAVREQVYLIGREALVNALRHSQATRIETEVEYLPSRLQVVIRDNGCGIDGDAMRLVRVTPSGLWTMHERAENIGARLEIWTRAGRGTEVKISIPSDIAVETGV